jgi:hypothetical protein
MSQQDIELARHGYEALNDALSAGRDPSALIAEMLDPDVVLEMRVLEGTFRGYEEVRRFIEGQVATIEGLRFHPEEFQCGESGREPSRGADRNRTGVNGFAGRCVATPPRRRGGV